MRILFLSHYFPPEVNAPAARVYEHCKQWVKMGHEVTVVSCVPHHPMGKAYPGYKNKLVHIEYIEGIKSVKVLTYITANEGFVRRIFNYFFFMIMTVLVAPFLPKSDVVISTSPQFFNGLSGYFVSRIKRCPWLLEIRDLWPESIVALGVIKSPKLIATLESVERFIYLKADFIVPVTNAFKTHILARGGRADRIEVIPNGVDLDFFSERPREETYAESLGVKDKFVVSYVGTHGMAHGLEIIIEAAELLRQREDIVFLMVGEGSERRGLVDEIAKRKLTNILILGQLPKEDMPMLWSVSAVSLVVLRKLDLFLSVIPSKIFESMAMKKPIILGVEGESKEIIKKAGAGIAIEPGNAAELAVAITRLADSPALCDEYGERGSEYVAAHFDRHVLAQRYEKKLRTLCEKE